MRYIPIKEIIQDIFVDTQGKSRKSLLRAHIKLIKKNPAERQEYIRKNGPTKWTPIKKSLVEVLGKKCWYTEVEIIGAPLAIDHYRPCVKYWWLAFDAENYRVASHFANSSEFNKIYGKAGGKGDHFPLLSPGIRAAGKSKLRLEKPVILDPCNKADCDLLAFQSDGRPVLNSNFAGDAIAVERVKESLLLLNLDHPDFNTQRAQLCAVIAEDVATYEELPVTSPRRTTISTRLQMRIAPKAAFSSAARYYLQYYKYYPWVKNLLDT